MAVITGGVGALGNIATYRIAKAQAEAELAKVRAENERLRAQHREDERRNRQGMYHRLLALLDSSPKLPVA